MLQRVQTLHEKLDSRTAVIGVCGLGYVGLPLAGAIAGRGFPVIGFDIDADKVNHLNAGRTYISHIPAELVTEMVESGQFEATGDFARIAEADVVTICVPTPLSRQREPDLSFVVATARSIAAHARPGQLIVLESTTYPGTTDEVLRPIFEERGFKVGEEVFLAFSPEREDPGNTDHSTSTIPKVIGGVGEEATALATKFYASFIKHVVPVSSAGAAEAVKLTENIFRAVNIALVNELKLIYSAMGIDIWEVIEAAKTKPFGYMAFYPGPGLGGHCVPIDPFYLTWKAREFEITTRFIELAGEINRAMPRHVMERLAEALDCRHGRTLNGARILLLGLSYKKNVDDLRESPSFKLIELIEGRGASCDYHDPFFPVVPMTREHAALAGRRSVDLNPDTIARYEAVLISTDHDEVDYPAVVRHAPLVVDTRNVCARLGLAGDNIVKA